MNRLVLALLGALLVVGVPTLPATGAGPDGPTTSPVAPVISGSGRVGETLSVTSLGSVGGDPADVTYVWLWDGDEDPGPGDTGASHTVKTADVGRHLSVLVRPADPDGERLESNRVLAVDAALVPPGVTVSGTVKVKHTLTAAFTSPPSAGADVTIAWTRDDVEIPGESADTYLLAPEDAGHVVRFRTTTTAPDGRSLDDSSRALLVPAYVTKKPTVSGTSKVGRTLKLRSKGSWSGDGYSFSTYRWLRNGKAIKGATRSSYKLTSKDRRKRISLRVTATKRSFPDVSAVSASTKVT